MTRILIVGADVGVIAREGWEIGGPYLWATGPEHVAPLTAATVSRVVWATDPARLDAGLVAAVRELERKGAQ